MAKSGRTQISFSPTQPDRTKEVIENLISPESPREMARVWLSQLSAGELKQEKACIESLIRTKRNSKPD